jgi:RecB family exonuclease
MELPHGKIGISDITSFRDCPRRFSFSMERWTEAGPHPETFSYPTSYGSAFHDAVDFMEKELCSDARAVQHAFAKWFDWLEPDDIERLTKDLATYRSRDETGLRLIGSELDIEIPLFEHAGQTISFRAKIDRLYERMDRPGHFIMRDFKTSAQPKSKKEVDEDLQFWAYNWAIHEAYPQCVDLEQRYDQLQFGVLSTGKTDADRALIRQWIELQIRALLEYEAEGPDGRPRPRKNDWCGTCAVKGSCPIVPRFTEFALAEMEATKPAAERTDEGRALIAKFVGLYDDAALGAKVLGAYSDDVKSMVGKLSDTEMERLGFKWQTRVTTIFSPEAKEYVRGMIGDEPFTRAVSITKAGIKNAGISSELAEKAISVGEEVVGSRFVVRVKAKKRKSKT